MPVGVTLRHEISVWLAHRWVLEELGLQRWRIKSILMMKMTRNAQLGDEAEPGQKPPNLALLFFHPTACCSPPFNPSFTHLVAPSLTS